MCEDCAAEIEDLRTSLAGAYNQISDLKDRVDDLESERADLESEIEMLRQEVADDKTGEMLHEY